MEHYDQREALHAVNKEKAEIKSIKDVKTDADAREFINAISNGIEDEMEFLDFYERQRTRGYFPPDSLRHLVYCYGLDLT